MGVIAILVSVVFAHRVPHLIEALVYLFGFFISLVGTIQLRKHRFFAIASTRDLEAITKEIELIHPQAFVSDVKFRTCEIIHDKKRYNGVPNWWPDRRSAYYWLLGLMIISTMGLLLSVALVMFRYHRIIAFWLRFVLR